MAIHRWRAELIDDLGGEDNIRTQQLAIIDLADKQKLLLDSIDTWLFSQPSLIDKLKRALLPVVRERESLVDGLAALMSQLGLERRRKVKSLNELLTQQERTDHSAEPVECANGPVNKLWQPFLR